MSLQTIFRILAPPRKHFVLNFNESSLAGGNARRCHHRWPVAVPPAAAREKGIDTAILVERIAHSRSSSFFIPTAFCTCSAAQAFVAIRLSQLPTPVYIYLSWPPCPRYPVAQTDGVSGMGLHSLLRPLAAAPAWTSGATGWGVMQLKFSANQ